MNESQINLDLYHKMREEQDKYRSWLLSQSPNEILDHASEYSVREEILATMCEGHLPPMLAKALLDTKQPLANVYSDWKKGEYGNYWDLIEAIQGRAVAELRQSPNFIEICIYQIDRDRDQNRVAFLNSEKLYKRQGSTCVESSIYNSVFQGAVGCSTLEDIDWMFNSNPPEGYIGHALVTSDVVQILHSEAVEPGFYFHESCGYKKIDFEPEKTQDMTHAIWVLLLKPGKIAQPVLVNNTLQDMQRLVGGHIEVLSLPDGGNLVCNENGKFLILPQNRAIKDKTGKVLDVINGTCFICGSKDDQLTGLTPKQLRHYRNKFFYPQKCVWRNNVIVAKDIKPHKTER